MTQSIIIIGGGIAGLAAGCYGQMNGYSTRIFELHDKPGGLCTAWKRKGYTFDGCIHWLVGSRLGSGTNQIWQELGAAQGRIIVDHEEFTRIEGEGGKALIVYTDVDRLEAHMKELAPEDEKLIEQFCGAIRRLSRFAGGMGGSSGASGPATVLKGLLGAASVLPLFVRYRRTTTQDFAGRFRNPFLREAFGTLFDLPDFPLVGMLFTMAWLNNRDAGYPIGGSLEFSRAIERRYLDLGGEIHYGCRVEAILVEEEGGEARAVGVRLSGGSERRADTVISAADGHATIFDMLGGRFVDDTIRATYDELPIFAPIVQVSLGVDRDLSGEPHSVSLPLATPITVGETEHRRMGFRHFCYDPTMAPPGKSAITVMLEASYDYWKELAEDRERYDAEKQEIALSVIGRLDDRFPGLEGQVEAVDVATPLTYERYTGNWQGSMEGWLLTTKTISSMFGRGMRKTLPGLANFHMAGQWVQPGGGLPTAAMSGRGAIQVICKREGREFTSSTL